MQFFEKKGFLPQAVNFGALCCSPVAIFFKIKPTDSSLTGFKIMEVNQVGKHLQMCTFPEPTMYSLNQGFLYSSPPISPSITLRYLLLSQTGTILGTSF